MVSSAPGWKKAICNALEKHEKSTVVQLASIDPTSPIPYVRSLIFRSFVTPSSNPSLPLFLTTTDVRTPKTAQIIANPHVHIAWWIEGTQEQFRIAGLGSIIPAPEDGLYKYFVHSTKLNSTSQERSGMTALNQDDEGFDWEKKRREVFKTMSGHMKASWCRPVPGSPLKGGEEESQKWPEKVVEPKTPEPSPDESEEEKENRRNYEKALRNFALLVVDPVEVDYVELGVLPNKRTRFWKTKKGEWTDEAIVP